MPVESVELYVNLFFDVRDRLGVRPFIMSQVLRKRPTDTITPSDWGFVVRFVGYVYGKSVLDTVTPLLLAPGLNVAGAPAAVCEMGNGSSTGVERPRSARGGRRHGRGCRFQLPDGHE